MGFYITREEADMLLQWMEGYLINPRSTDQRRHDVAEQRREMAELGKFGTTAKDTLDALFDGQS